MILLFSGGIDSYIAYHYLGKPQTVYFDLNSRYSRKERETVKKLIPTTIIEAFTINFESREIGENAYVPYRNLHLALLANKYSDTIVIAGVKDDRVNDKNLTVFEHFSKLMSDMMDKDVKVTSPFWDMTKEEVVGWFLKNGGTKENLLATISCYSTDETNYCGKCPACFRKWCALTANGIYDLEFYNDELMKKYFYEAMGTDKYEQSRRRNIINQVLKTHPEWR